MGRPISKAQTDIIFELRVKKLMDSYQIAAVLGVERRSVDRKLALWPWYGQEWLACARCERQKNLARQVQSRTMVESNSATCKTNPSP